MNDATQLVISTVLATLITGLVTYFTQRSSARAAVHNQAVVSRTDIEKEALLRAEKYYQNAMTRQEADIARQDTEITRQDTEIQDLHVQVRDLKDKVHALILDKEADRETIRNLRAELVVAQNALRVAVHDDE